MLAADVLPQAQAKVLVALLRLEGRAARTTVRSVADEAGLRSTSSCWVQLVKLRDAGLVRWDEESRGTLRSTVAVLPIGAE